MAHDDGTGMGKSNAGKRRAMRKVLRAQGYAMNSAISHAELRGETFPRPSKRTMRRVAGRKRAAARKAVTS